MSIDTTPVDDLDVPEFMRPLQPQLSLVKDDPEPVEGTVVEHHGDTSPADGAALAKRTPRGVQAAIGHVLTHRMYLGWSARGYRVLVRRWVDARRDDYPQMIHSARVELKAAAGDTGAEESAKTLVTDRRAAYRLHKRWWWIKSSAWGTASSAGLTTAALAGGGLVDLLLAAGVVAVGAWHGRPGAQVSGPAEVSASELSEMELTTAPATLLDKDTLAAAFKAIGLPSGGQILTSHWESDDACTTVVDLPAGVTVTALRAKIEAFAAALGRDESMIDITKAGAAGRASIWMTDNDPFADRRPSPLVTHPGEVDAFKTGVPVAWNKRGETVTLPVNNSSFVIGGMTRSGKGVGAANLIAGAALDPRFNLRIVAGKVNGEWDPYAAAEVAATYFKPNPERLLALLRAERADMDRRNKILGELGKSKLTPETINRLGGIEVLVIDELATYSRSGKPLREEILAELIELSAVAAGAGILLVLITQYPEVDVLPQALAMNCGTRWAMRVDNATQSNAILGGGASSSGRDASKFDPPLPGLGWLVNPFAGVTDKARSFDLDEDERGEITKLMERAAALRHAAGRLAGQFDDPIERALAGQTGLSSAAGGPRRNGEPGRVTAFLSDEQRAQLAAARGAIVAMDRLGRDVAQLGEMADLIGDGMTAQRLGELLRAAGAGGTVKITVPGVGGRVNGYRAADIHDAVGVLEDE